MSKLYLLIAGVLTGAGVGLITGHVVSWLAAGAAMGVVLCAAARPRSTPQASNFSSKRAADWSAEESQETQKLTAKG